MKIRSTKTQVFLHESDTIKPRRMKNKWYMCPECACSHINIRFNYCPICGSPIVWMKNEELEVPYFL